MQRFMIVVLVLLFSMSLLIADINWGIGIDLAGNQEISQDGYSGSVDQDTNMGFEIFSEYINPLSNSTGLIVEAGLGAAWLIPRGYDDNDDEFEEAFSFIPLYGLLQLSTNNPNSLNIYGKAKIGYNFFYGNDDYAGDSDLTGGLYTGFGGGIISRSNFFMELSYQTYNGTSSNDYWGIDRDVVQTQLSILLGVRVR
jgi:hypothetical protein